MNDTLPAWVEAALEDLMRRRHLIAAEALAQEHLGGKNYDRVFIQEASEIFRKHLPAE